MRIAANEVERALALAAAETRYDGPERREDRADELIEAMSRATELRHRAFGHAIVRGLKDKVAREVVTTGFTKVVGRTEYRLCLMPFVGAEGRARMTRKPRYWFKRGGRGRWMDYPAPRTSPKLNDRDLLAVKTALPYHSHELWIRENRLERTGS